MFLGLNIIYQIYRLILRLLSLFISQVFKNKKIAYLGQVIDVGALCNQQTGDVLVTVMSGNVQRSETAFGCDVRIVITLFR